jgi:rhodanese-related sulfurtransferase
LKKTADPFVVKAMSIPVINPLELAELCKHGKKFDLIDVRTPVEYRELHVDFARNVPLDQLDPAALLQARIANHCM